MKKFLCLLLSLLMIISSFNLVVFAEDEIKVIVNGNALVMDQNPIIVEGRTLVPLRAIFEALGAKVEWDDATKTATGILNDKTVSLIINNTVANVNGSDVTLDVPAQIVNSRTLVPVRFISESLGADVGWDGDTKTVRVDLEKEINKNNIDYNKYPIETIDGKRDVPNDFTLGKTYDDLIFLDENRKSPDEVFASLVPERVIVTEEDFLKSNKEGDKEYGEISVVDVEGMPFTKAIKFNATKVPEKVYSYNANLKFEEKLLKDHVYLLKVSYRITSGGNPDNGEGLLQFCVQETETGAYSAAVQQNIPVMTNWQTNYIPFIASDKVADKMFRIQVRPGFFVQDVEVGGYQLIDFGTKYKMEDLPVTAYYKGMERDAQWRKDAWDRIEKIRKGDIIIKVVDENGNKIKDADVKLDMYEHEFEWGAAVYPEALFDENERGKNYRKNLMKYFNGAVSENSYKWVIYEKDKQLAYDIAKWCRDNGMKHFRGHAFMWDRLYYEGNTSLPKEVNDVFDDYDKVQSMIKEHIFDMAGNLNDVITEWDVLNEMCHIPETTIFRTKYGMEIYLEWFKWAREAAPDAKLYFNEGSAKTKTDNLYPRMMEFMKWAHESGLDYDGVGHQGHMGMPAYPMDYYDVLTDYSTYADEIKVTEFDINMSNSPNENLQANYLRDMLIVMFSHPKCTGVYTWRWWAGGWNANEAILFNDDWTLKMCGKVYEDLVYNKWWTNESGKTDKTGEFKTRGFYGDYTITVSANGKTVTVDTSCYKGNNNVIEIVVK